MYSNFKSFIFSSFGVINDIDGGKNYHHFQDNNAISCTRNIQNLLFESFGNSKQTNRANSFFNIQNNFFTNGGTAVQICEDGSGGNIQINYNVVGKQQIGPSYSYNLQLNVIKCSRGQRDEVKTHMGNVWILKCYQNSISEANVEHEGLAVKYKIWLQPCLGSEKLVVDNGNVYYQSC